MGPGAALEVAHAKYKDLQEGKNADYIPALAKVPSNLFGIVLVTVDGQVFVDAKYVPGVLAVMATAGNSVRAQKAIADVSAALGGNPYAVTPR